MRQYLVGSSAIWIIKPSLGPQKINFLQFSASLANMFVAKIVMKCQKLTDHSLIFNFVHIRWV